MSVILIYLCFPLKLIAEAPIPYSRRSDISESLHKVQLYENPGNLKLGTLWKINHKKPSFLKCI